MRICEALLLFVVVVCLFVCLFVCCLLRGQRGNERAIVHLIPNRTEAIICMDIAMGRHKKSATILSLSLSLSLVLWYMKAIYTHIHVIEYTHTREIV